MALAPVVPLPRIASDYLMYLDQGICYARNGNTGITDFAGSDHAGVIQSAIDAVGPCGVFEFGKAEYNIDTALMPVNKQTYNLAAGVRFRPAGNNSIFLLSGIEQLSFQGTLQIEDPGGLSTSEPALAIEALAFSYFERIVIRNYYKGLTLTGTIGGTHENHFADIWAQVRHEGVSLETACHDNKFNHVFVKGPAPDSHASGPGLRVATSGTQGGNAFPNIEVLDMNRGVELPGAFEIFFGRIISDNAYGEGLLVSGATERLFIESIWAASCGDGLRMEGTAENPLTEFNIGQIYAWLNANHGVDINGYVSNFNFGTVSVNNNDNFGLRIRGADVKEGCIGSLISFANAVSGSDPVKIGVSGSGITGDVFIRNAIISDTCDLSGFTEVSGSLPGAGLLRNKGTATIPNGSTSIAVNHGLGKTPVADDIQVTPTNNMGSATKFWASNPTTTQFTISVDADPGAGTATFSWSVRI